MRTWRLVTLVAALFAVMAVAAPVSAQETRGSIEGTVKDATGGALPGVTVQAKQGTTGAIQTTVTDSNGAYRFPALAPGVYDVSATLQGFNAAKLDKVEVAIGFTAKVPLTMTVAGVSVVETVQGASPIVDVKQNAVSVTVSADLIDLIPKDRNFLSALTGIAGTNNEDRAGGLSIDGASGSENRVIIDGQDATNPRTGVINTQSVVVDFIEQIQLKQSGYAAEYRATTGGVVSAITKSGSNQYHGDGSFYLSGKQLLPLQGDLRPSLRLDPSVTINAPPQYFTTPRTSQYETQTIDPTVDVSGPIFKNKAWFFFGANPSARNQDRTVRWCKTTTLPCVPNNLDAAGNVIAPEVQEFNAKRSDATFSYNSTVQLTHSLRMRITGNNQRITSDRGLPSVDAATFDQNQPGISTSNPASFNPWPTIHREDFNNNYSGVFDWVLNNKTYSNITAGYYSNGTGSKDGDYFHGIRRTFSASNVNYLDVPPELQHPNNYAENPTNVFTLYDNYTRYSVSGDITRYADWNGQHAFKTGVQFERIGNDTNSGQQDQNVALVWNGTRTTLDNRLVRGTYGYYTVLRDYTIGSIHGWNTGIFLQDQWTFNNKLTLNYGARFDRTDIPSYRPENPGITFGFGDKFAPRIGFAYDIKGDSKWKAYGSWGLFYDIEKLEMPRGAWGAEHWTTYYWTLDDYNWQNISCDGTPTSVPKCPGTYIEQNDLRHVSNDPSNNLVDPNLKPYKTQELVFGLDHELNRLMSVGTRWSHKWLNRTIEDVGVSVPGVGEVFYISNPGVGLGAYPLGTDFPISPDPIRNYDSVEFRFQRRLANNWSLTSNFLISRLFGNYSGLASSDENGRTSPNVNRYYDGLFMNFSEKGCPSIVDCNDLVTYGRLQNDRPFQFKLQGTYVAPWKWAPTIGVNFTAQSGLLQTSSISYKGVPVMIYGRGNLGRSPTFNATDIQLGYRMRLPQKMTLFIQLTVSNVFDQDIVTRFFSAPYRTTTVPLPNDAAFFAGFNTQAIMAATLANCLANPSTTCGNTGTAGAQATTMGRPDPRFGLADQFQGERSARLTFSLRF